MIVSRGLVDPKANLKLVGRKGNRLIFLYSFALKPTLRASAGRLVCLFKPIARRRTVTVGRRVTRDDASGVTPGAREKGANDPYQDPTLVPLAEKAKACRHTLAKGIRQISPVTSG
jgi:hypothetical protein